jgi:hypothetical protein
MSTATALILGISIGSLWSAALMYATYLITYRRLSRKALTIPIPQSQNAQHKQAAKT